MRACTHIHTHTFLSTNYVILKLVKDTGIRETDDTMKTVCHNVTNSPCFYPILMSMFSNNGNLFL